MSATKRKVILWVILPLGIAATSVVAALAWTYSTNYSLTCDRATAIVGHQLCDNNDGWAHEPTATEWSKIDSVLRSEHLAGNIWLLLAIGLVVYVVLLTGVALHKRGKSLWWLMLLVLGPLAILVGVVALAALSGGSTKPTPYRGPGTGTTPPPRPKRQKWIAVLPDGRTQGPFDQRFLADQVVAEVNATIDRGQYVPYPPSARAFVQVVMV
jgi:hypothetical protein